MLGSRLLDRGLLDGPLLGSGFLSGRLLNGSLLGSRFLNRGLLDSRVLSVRLLNGRLLDSRFLNRGLLNGPLWGHRLLNVRFRNRRLRNRGGSGGGVRRGRLRGVRRFVYGLGLRARAGHPLPDRPTAPERITVRGGGGLGLVLRRRVGGGAVPGGHCGPARRVSCGGGLGGGGGGMLTGRLGGARLRDPRRLRVALALGRGAYRPDRIDRTTGYVLPVVPVRSFVPLVAISVLVAVVVCTPLVGFGPAVLVLLPVLVLPLLWISGGLLRRRSEPTPIATVPAGRAVIGRRGGRSVHGLPRLERLSVVYALP
ncbi:hypothetical protein GCM10012285_15190 [Streptomyces kronopolitis]|uniref:Pentapeptide repeat-containing protein n=1 Tax=Streptomyces kronopolitis TaxID=1612435 RepID=A0ABQ2J6H4_9ACTN|nr:hypothetical protein GCM10012285_15190 [Streptomyces kronopolitis]